MEFEITIFTLENCVICNFLKGELKERGRKYEEIKIDKNEELGDTLEQIYKTSIYPIIFLKEKKTKKEIILLRETDLEISNRIITFDVNDIPKILDQYEI